MQRHMPMGYRMRNGKIFLEEENAKIVRKIFSDYLSGISAYAIAKELNVNGALNANNKPSWSHNSVGKILENVKYMGDELYPQMIEKEIFNQVQNRREEGKQKIRHVMQVSGRSNKNPFIGRVCCGECGEIFRKYVENCGKPSEKSKWKCKKYIYKNRVHCICGTITEEQIKEVFVRAVNQIIKTPSLLEKKPKECPRRYPPKFWRVDQRIRELEADEQFSSKELAMLIFQRSELLYQTAQVFDYEYHTENIKQALAHKELQTEFQETLFLQIIKRMIIYKNGRIEVEFINGLKIHETYKNEADENETYKNRKKG
ncbi:MAG: recombinase family protein [Lacrimispora sp.]|uniref:recombinase family protein n=1 Tax=Lacrimispora sp. TaxID=2719234 RepID=UPI0039E4C13E